MNLWKNAITCLALAGALTIMTTGCMSQGDDPNDDNQTNLSDIDKDKTPDILDDDIDGDNIKNTQDPDIDGDGIINTKDDDIDGDGTKNIDDNDIDGDGIINTQDNDIDGDGISNTKDDDIDNDGIKNIDDNDIDGDGVINTTDDDIDGDGSKNVEDNDIDGDGIANNDDIDIDGDGIINKDDSDTDNDGTPNTTDTTPNGNSSTTNNGNQGNSNSGTDNNNGTTNNGTDQNNGNNLDDTEISGIALTVTDTLNYKLSARGLINGTINRIDTVHLKDIRDEIEGGGISLASFSVTNLTMKGTASGTFMQDNGAKKVVVRIYYMEGGNQITIAESPATEGLGTPMIKLSDLSTGLALNKQIFATTNFGKFIGIIKDVNTADLVTGVEIKFVDSVNASNSDIDLNAVMKISGIKKL